MQLFMLILFTILVTTLYTFYLFYFSFNYHTYCMSYIALKLFLASPRSFYRNCFSSYCGLAPASTQLLSPVYIYYSAYLFRHLFLISNYFYILYARNLVQTLIFSAFCTDLCLYFSFYNFLYFFNFLTF